MKVLPKMLLKAAKTVAEVVVSGIVGIGLLVEATKKKCNE